MSTEPAPETTMALDDEPFSSIRATVESLCCKLQAERDRWLEQEDGTIPPVTVLVPRELFLEYIALRRTRTQSTSSEEWYNMLDLAQDTAGLFSSQDLMEGPNKEAVELFFGCLAIILWLGPDLARQTEVDFCILHDYIAALAFYLNRHDYVRAISGAKQIDIALADLLRLSVHVTLFYLSKERNIWAYHKCFPRSIPSTQQGNGPNSFDHEEAKKFLESTSDSHFGELRSAVTQSTATLVAELEDSNYALLVSGITNQEFSEFAAQYKREHPSRSGTLQSAMALTSSLSLLENATAQAIKQAAELILKCFQVLFQLRHCEDRYLENVFGLFHKYDLALSESSTAIFEDRQKLSDALVETIEFSVGSVVFYHRASEVLHMDNIAQASMMKSYVQHLSDTAFLLCVFESRKKLQQRNLEPKNAQKSFVSKATAAYEFRDLPGYGIAAFATQEIPRGIRVMDEFPLLFIEVGRKFVTPFDIWNRLNDQPAECQESFRALYHSIKNRDMARQEINQLTEGLKVKESTIDVDDVALVAAIWHTNSFGAAAQHFKYAVYKDQSRLNHMCTFNLMQISKPDGSQHMLAMRDIKEGEQLTCPYIETRDPYQERQRHLKNWGFTCTCPLCQMEAYVDKTPDLKIEEIAPGLDQQGLTDMLKFIRIWFDAIQVDCEEDWRRKAAEKNGIEVKDAGLMFERALCLFEHMSKEEKDSSPAAVKLTEVNKTTMENILTDLRGRRQY